jgi:hypothetical protein
MELLVKTVSKSGGDIFKFAGGIIPISYDIKML